MGKTRKPDAKRKLGRNQRFDKILNEYVGRNRNYFSLEASTYSDTFEEWKGQNKCRLCGVSGEKTELKPCQNSHHDDDEDKICDKCLICGSCRLCAYIDDNYSWCHHCETSTVCTTDKNWKYFHPTEIEERICEDCFKERIINGYKVKRNKWVQVEPCVNSRRCHSEAAFTNEKMERVCRSCFLGQCSNCWTEFNLKTIKNKSVNEEGKDICKTCSVELLGPICK